MITACLIVAVFHVFFDIAYVSGNSMEPVFYEGDILLLRKWGMPKRGDIIAAYIEELDYDVVKRILASEGDRVTAAYEGLFLNGKKVAESVKGIQEERKKQERQEFILPPDQYFLIGENQEVSLDSRIFGCIGKSAVHGIVVCKLF